MHEIHNSKDSQLNQSSAMPASEMLASSSESSSVSSSRDGSVMEDVFVAVSKGSLEPTSPTIENKKTVQRQDTLELVHEMEQLVDGGHDDHGSSVHSSPMGSVVEETFTASKKQDIKSGMTYSATVTATTPPLDLSNSLLSNSITTTAVSTKQMEYSMPESKPEAALQTPQSPIPPPPPPIAANGGIGLYSIRPSSTSTERTLSSSSTSKRLEKQTSLIESLNAELEEKLSRFNSTSKVVTQENQTNGSSSNKRGSIRSLREVYAELKTPEGSLRRKNELSLVPRASEIFISPNEGKRVSDKPTLRDIHRSNSQGQDTTVVTSSVHTSVTSTTVEKRDNKDTRVSQSSAAYSEPDYRESIRSIHELDAYLKTQFDDAASVDSHTSNRILNENFSFGPSHLDTRL